MSFESSYWKTILKKDVDYILKKMSVDLGIIDDEQKFEKIVSTVEIKLFVIAYSLRKLIDSNKVSKSLSSHKINVVVYPRNSKRTTLWTKSHFEEYYDFNRKRNEKLEIRYICNQIIHSYIFQQGFYGRKIFYIFFNSDKTKEQSLYRLKIKDFLKTAIKFSNNYPKSFSVTYDEEKSRFLEIAQ